MVLEKTDNLNEKINPSLNCVAGGSRAILRRNPASATSSALLARRAHLPRSQVERCNFNLVFLLAAPVCLLGRRGGVVCSVYVSQLLLNNNGAVQSVRSSSLHRIEKFYP